MAIKLKLQDNSDNSRYWSIETGKRLYQEYLGRVGYKNTFKNGYPIHRYSIKHYRVFLSYDGGLFLDFDENRDLVFVGNYPDVILYDTDDKAVTKHIQSILEKEFERVAKF